MRHLKLETLARLVDEAPEPAEAAHLEACATCRDELEALRDQTASLATLPALMPTPDAWPQLRERLGAEGLVRGGVRRWRPAPLQAAAAVALFLAGGALGFAVRGSVDSPADTMVAQAEDPPVTGEDAKANDASANDASAFAAAAPSAGAPAPETLSEEVERTEEMFAAALDRFMASSGTGAPDPATRLAALDHIVMTTAEALNASPADPVINSYHLTAVAQRKALIRQLSSSREPPF